MDLENDREIDTEALQAQIDLSMSFAQDMVSSWVKPHKLPKSSRRNDLELELKEYMKKPPRLGVGAAIPSESQSMARETARLKGRLTGSKRIHDGESSSAKRKSPVDEEDDRESRSSAIQKKQRVDPFAGTHGKKKKKQTPTGSTTPQHTNPAPASQITRPNATMVQKPSPPSSPAGSSKTPDSQTNVNGQPSTSTTNIQISPLNNTIDGTISNSTTPVPASPQKQPQPDVSHPSSPVKKEPKTIPPELLKKPLLNLDGPPPESDSDDIPDASPTSPKKKRKRRKKKKHVTGTTPQS
ncbi:hypothetical protein CVT24_010639 [Panaeolus cyanescens]|uniref:Uncharacterized protein n=1 Tax=Panaeolus cyanescens TaxID=181874 RepID=A0A409YN97_9AGAR|nr:hypothetical protein CVT24_010639 [Panaeolus cyanescens]